VARSRPGVVSTTPITASSIRAAAPKTMPVSAESPETQGLANATSGLSASRMPIRTSATKISTSGTNHESSSSSCLCAMALRNILRLRKGRRPMKSPAVASQPAFFHHNRLSSKPAPSRTRPAAATRSAIWVPKNPGQWEAAGRAAFLTSQSLQRPKPNNSPAMTERART
jgi:hypothetical protein